MKTLIDNMWYVLGALAIIFAGLYLLTRQSGAEQPQEPVQATQQQTINNQTSMDTLKQGQEFLAANKDREGVITTDSGLQYEVLTAVESGDKPAATSTVEVHYHGTTIDGNVFDSSVVRGETISFGLNQVISGWTEGLQLMKVGEKFKFYIPADLAYGDYSPSAAIPANSTLIFEVELFNVQ